MNNFYYICHHCCDYSTTYKSDIKRHFERKNKCKCNNMLNSYENSIILSINKKFIFNNVNISKLQKEDFLFIVNNYGNDINYINKNYKKINNKNHEINLNQIKLNEIKNESNLNENIKNESNLNYLQIDNLDKIKLELSNLNVHNLQLTNNINDTNNKSEIEKSLFDLNNYYNEDEDKYCCKFCDFKFKYKQSLERHLLDKKRCEKNQKIKQAIAENAKNILINQEKQKIKESIQNTFIQNNNNTQNIQNNNNKNSNTHNSTYNVDIKDFVHDRYDLSHIKDDFYEQKDFFLYHNLLKMIMENKNNQNIFFSNNEAIIYTDNELNKMSSDKAGYMVLDKLSQSFDQLFYDNDKETQNYYAFIQKYYHVIKGHYKHDTIYKEYNVDDRQFMYTANSRLFRSRDKYLTKIGSTLSKYKDSARENMMISLDEVNNIPTINPNIEDFSSIKMRYRDLKDRD